MVFPWNIPDDADIDSDKPCPFLSHLCEIGVIAPDDDVFYNFISGILCKKLGDIPVGLTFLL
jgi:hypothetical protein